MNEAITSKEAGKFHEVSILFSKEHVAEIVSKFRTDTGVEEYDRSDGEILEAFIFDLVEKCANVGFIDNTAIMKTLFSN